MAKRQESLFNQLTRLFRQGPVVKRKIRSVDTRVAGPSPMSTGAVLMSKTMAPVYSNALFGAHAQAFQERLARLQDFNEMDGGNGDATTALNIFADEATAQDIEGRILHIFSDNPKIKKNLKELFYDTLNVEYNLRPWTRSACKFGDWFLFLDVSEKYGVQSAIPVPINEIVREEGFDPENPMNLQFRWSSLGNKTLDAWQVCHFRILGSDSNLPYGTSMLDGARKLWRQLIMSEDAMLVYRTTRATDKLVFNVEVGNTSADEVPNLMQQVKSQIVSQYTTDQSSGRSDQRYNPVTAIENIYIASRGGDPVVKIETLPAGNNTANVEDVQYLHDKYISALQVPKAYMGYGETATSQSSLSQQDVRFSRTINMIQKAMITELNKIAMIHLFCCGFRGEDLLNFSLQLSNPSTVAQRQKLDLLKTKLEIVSAAEKETFPEVWLYKKVLNMTDQEILQVSRMKLEGIKMKKSLEAAEIASGGEEGDSEEDAPEDAEGGDSEEAAAPDEEAPEGGEDLGDLDLAGELNHNRDVIAGFGFSSPMVPVSNESDKFPVKAKPRSDRKKIREENLQRKNKFNQLMNEIKYIDRQIKLNESVEKITYSDDENSSSALRLEGRTSLRATLGPSERAILSSLSEKIVAKSLSRDVLTESVNDIDINDINLIVEGFEDSIPEEMEFVDLEKLDLEKGKFLKF